MKLFSKNSFTETFDPLKFKCYLSPLQLRSIRIYRTNSVEDKLKIAFTDSSHRGGIPDHHSLSCYLSFLLYSSYHPSTSSPQAHTPIAVLREADGAFHPFAQRCDGCLISGEAEWDSEHLIELQVSLLIAGSCTIWPLSVLSNSNNSTIPAGADLVHQHFALCDRYITFSFLT